RSKRDWSSDVCSSDLLQGGEGESHRCAFRGAVTGADARAGQIVDNPTFAPRAVKEVGPPRAFDSDPHHRIVFLRPLLIRICVFSSLVKESHDAPHPLDTPGVTRAPRR